MAKSSKKPAQEGPKPSDPPAANNTYQTVFRAFCLLALAAVYSPLSQSKLAPVYGSIPSSQFHHLGSAFLALLALTRSSLFSHWVPNRIPNFLQVVAAWTPTIQSFLYKYSSKLGPTFGPLLTEGVTYYPLLFLTAYTVSGLLRSARLDQNVHHALGDTGLGLAAYGTFTTLEYFSWPFVAWTSSLSRHFTRTAMQLVVGLGYFALSPSKLYVATMLPLLQTIVFDPRSTAPFATDRLHSSLNSHNWTLLDRGESVTGYVSVLEDMNMQYRLLRCDHSLLGGEWLVNDERRQNGIIVPEPIYAVFEMLEAVRLVELPDNTKKDNEKNALVMYV